MQKVYIYILDAAGLSGVVWWRLLSLQRLMFPVPGAQFNSIQYSRTAFPQGVEEV